MTLPRDERSFRSRTRPTRATSPSTRREASFPPIEPLRPPAGAPNVLIVLLDDVGFAASSAFGGPVDTPTAERLAASGLKYNRFHTTALCAPTRAALLTGRNHHTVGMGVITELATSAPGYNSLRPNTCAPLAQTLHAQRLLDRPVRQVPRGARLADEPHGTVRRLAEQGGGFEYFYGFIGGETNQYYPAIYEGTNPVEPEKTPEEGYHFTEDMTDKAIAWVRQQKALMHDKPFFIYFAPGATHAPHHVPKEWSDKYQGRFDQGWDALREETLARQKELGVVPARLRAHAEARGDPRVGRHTRRAQADPGAADGDLRRLPRAHRPPRRPARGHAGGPRRPRRHADLLHHRRQRRERRGHPQGHASTR